MIEPVSVNPDSTYFAFWDTLKITDGYYYLKANVIDTTNLSAETIMGPVKVDNPTPPTIDLAPLAATVSGIVTLSATCFDEDSTLSSDGVSFYLSSDNSTWIMLGRTPTYMSVVTGQNRVFRDNAHKEQ